MILKLSSTLASDYQPPALLKEHGPTSAFDPDRDSSQSELFSIAPYPRPVISRDIASHDYSEGISFEPSRTLADYLAGPIDLRSRLDAEFASKEKQARETYHAYWTRIELLRSDAELDGFTVNEASVEDFWSFVTSVPFVRKAELVLVDNGNLRAVWGGEEGSHLGLQFLGDHTLQYVIFRRRTGSRHISRVAGRDTFEGIKRQVRTFELEAFLQAWPATTYRTTIMSFDM